MRQLNEFAIGTYTGTGSAVSVTCGFKPVRVVVINETDGDSKWEHIRGMADASALQDVNHDTAQKSFITSNGITLSNSGFTAGSSLSESAKVFRYIAY